jgi:hypothetical protein
LLFLLAIIFYIIEIIEIEPEECTLPIYEGAHLIPPSKCCYERTFLEEIPDE